MADVEPQEGHTATLGPGPAGLNPGFSANCTSAQTGGTGAV
jgi:hypothetical protein